MERGSGITINGDGAAAGESFDIPRIPVKRKRREKSQKMDYVPERCGKREETRL